MRRTKASGGDAMTANMSYTNLAAMASEFENTQTSHRVPGAVAAAAAGSSGSPESQYSKAMELIQMGLKLDLNNPSQASEYYQLGADLLSQALEAGHPDPQKMDEMQRTLDMVEERVRFISRDLLGRGLGGSENSLTSALPSASAAEMDEPSPLDATRLAEQRASNYFDLSRPNQLPPLVQQGAAACAAAFEQLVRQFGFQQESAFCQQEHLAMLIANCASRERDSADGLSVLHSKLLSNYKAWSRQLGITPQCAGESDVSHNKATDLVLCLLVWGEAANLKHVPESLCFLFHQMRTELWSTTKAAAPHRPQGWFLSRVVAPLYRVMRTEMNRKTPGGKPLGHTHKCNYDDFNEFFWTAECLRYSYYLGDEEGAHEPASSFNCRSFAGVRPGLLHETFGAGAAASAGPPISKMPYRKKYVERRSWLHPLRSFFRVHAFLICMLHIELAFAFCDRRTGLIFDGQLCQAVVGVVVTHAALGVLRELLAIFAMHGMLHTHPANLGSLLLRLSLKVAAVVVLGSAYSAMIAAHPFETVREMPVHQWVVHVLQPAETFYYGTLVYAAPVALSTLAQIFPPLSSCLRQLRGPLKVVVDIFEPLNRLFVGKDIHTNLSDKLAFDFFWVSLLCLKFTFSYKFQIQPLAEPTRDIWALDLETWYPGIALGKMPNLVVIFVRWLPLMIMYMIDTQLWFMLWTAMYGTVIGCNLHIGEVPDLNTVREMFLLAAQNFNRKVVSAAVGLDSAIEKPFRQPAFARRAAPASVQQAAQTGLALANDLAESFLEGDDHLDGGSGDIRNESLRYFADAWNAVLHDMRQGDLLSNHELGLLVFRCWASSGSTHFSRCTYLPVFCTAGKLNDAFHIIRSLSAEGEHADLKKRHALEVQLHTDMSANFEVREALCEFLELTQWLLAGLLGERHAAAARSLLVLFNGFVSKGEVLDVMAAGNLAKLSTAVVDLAKTALALKLAAAPVDAKTGLVTPRLDEKSSVGKLVDKLRSTLDTLKAVIGRAPKAVVQELEAIKFTGSGLFWDDAYARSTIASLRAEEQATEKLQGLISLCTTAAVDTMPEEYEVKRRLCWFVGSLFMEMPRSPPVVRMHSWTVMTPFYSEDLLYSAKELAAKTEDGVSMLIFLKTVHETEWNNFLERVGVKPGSEGEARLFTEKALLEELRLWASFRGQTLTRTVEGMMLHERALKLLASWEGLGGRELDQTAQLKFQYVVSCQAYGNHKKSRDLKAADTEFLLQRYPSLRVAYVDKASSLTKVSETDGRAALKEAIRFYSVLMKGVRSETGEALVQEIYRVQLPGDIMLGEGKPENQNHAMIFTRGEALQTIDMNQCGYLEEALKMRNLLCEFRTHPDAPHAPTILGFREHIFTGTSKQLSSLASYMALQEGCFVTLTQRVLWNPLQVRLHYGHPDVFDKLFSMTRGGVSKASRGINLSEDIYAGFNHLLRGATIPYIEYVQVGKGRDVGMQQIYKFEAKLASGNAEQCLSRDVYRIGQRLDFMRLLSFYYSGPGFYFNNACTVFAMFVFLYLQLWSHILQLDAEVPHADLLNAQWVLQLGLLLTVPIICYLAVEHGLWHSVSKFVETFLTGSPLFFMFHMGTKAHYYDSTLKYGGAKYRPTGRGFVLQHEDFAELYRFHSASHLYNGFELLWGLLLLMTLGDWWWKGDGPDLGGGGMGQYWRTTWSLWAVMIAWLFAPFWFNPLAFDQGKLRQDVQAWLMWMRRKDGNPLTSWEAWYEEEHSYTTTGSWMKRLHIVSPGIRYGLTFIGLLAALSEQKLHDGVLLELQVLGSLVGGVAGLLLLLLFSRWLLQHSPLALRIGSTFLLIGGMVAVPIILSYVSLFQLLLLFAAVGYFLAAAIRIPFMFGCPRYGRLPMQAYDYLCGGLLLGLCLVCSAPQFCRALQTKSLLSAVFERRVAHNEIMRLLQTTE